MGVGVHVAVVSGGDAAARLVGQSAGCGEEGQPVQHISFKCAHCLPEYVKIQQR
jgi:hypothetical protein